MPIVLSNKKTDKEGYDIHYRDKISPLSEECRSPQDYIKLFEETSLKPFYKGGNTKGYVRGLTVDKLLQISDARGTRREQLTILDAGCGQGELSTYLACKGFNVVGVDISTSACQSATQLTERIGVSNKCTFRAESLEHISVESSSIDFIIGHASLHHFIKYEKVPAEFYRVMKTGANGYFADSFGENPFYRIFHNKQRMERLGDVLLSKKLIDEYFDLFDVQLTPTDWFVMLDKLYSKIFPDNFNIYLRQLSKVHYWLDRKIPESNRIALTLSGAILTIITKPPQY